VSSLQRGDDEFHYSDHSHRWIAPPDVDQDVWEAELAAHLETHRTSLGRPLAAEGKCRAQRTGVAARPAAVPVRMPARFPGRMPARIIPERPVKVGASRR
jgi:hypothetical protein